MNKTIMKKMGFVKEMECVNQGLCVFCKKPVNQKDFRDELSRKEFNISGICQDCQDKTFGK